MGKKLIFLIFTAIIVSVSFFGCRSVPSPTDPNAPGGGSGIKFTLAVQRVDNGGMTLSQVMAVVTDSSGSTLTTASVSLDGPSGNVGFATNGYFSASAFSDADFQFGAQYAVSITNNAVNYYGTFTCPGDVTVAGDGSTVSWSTPCVQAVIAVYDPAMSMYTYSTTNSTSYNLAGTGVYSHGSGSYQVAPTVVKTTTGFMSGTDITSAVVFQQMKMVAVTK